MSIIRIGKVINIAVLCFAATFLIVAYHLYSNLDDHIHHAGKRYATIELTNELLRSSRGLTENIRLFILTRNPKYEQEYFNIYNERAGNIPRSEDKIIEPGRKVSLIALFEEYAFSHKDYLIARKAYDLSEELALLENAAMHTAKGIFPDAEGNTVKGKPDWNKARQLIFNDSYIEQQKAIIRPLQEILLELNKNAISYTKEVESNMLRLGQIFIFLVVCFSMISIAWIYYSKKYIQIPFEKITALSENIVDGFIDSKSKKELDNELEHLAHTLGLVEKRLEQEVTLSSTDALTQLHNRRAFERKLLEFQQDCDRGKHELSILILDIDFFKSVNDRFGHVYGDEILRKFADAVKKCSREGDFVARIGGEEFAVLVQLPIEKAGLFAERIRKAVESSILLPDGTPLTCSIGIAQYIPPKSQDTLLQNADSALYQAKLDGRNRVRFFPPENISA